MTTKQARKSVRKPSPSKKPRIAKETLRDLALDQTRPVKGGLANQRFTETCNCTKW